MDIIGHLNLGSDEEASGTIIVQKLNGSGIIAVSHTDHEGNFEIPGLPDADLKFFGICGKQLDESEASAALADDQNIDYVALLPAHYDTELGIYLNAASSLIATHFELEQQGNIKDSDAWTRDFLFGNFLSKMLSGYTTDFMAATAPPSVFDADKFAAMVKSSGNCRAYCRKLVKGQLDKRPGELPFASQEKGLAIAQEDAEDDTGAPTIPASANWAYKNPAWWSIIEQHPNMTTGMKQMADTIDGIAYMASQGNTTLAETATEEGTLGNSLGDFAKWAKGQMTGAVGSFVSNYLLNLCKDSIFGEKSKKQEIINTLGKIRTQLNTVVSNQHLILQDLNAIIHLLDANTLENIMLTLDKPVSTIKSNAQKLRTYSGTQSGKSSSSLHDFAKKVLDQDKGVYEAMVDINTIIQQVAGINLPKAMRRVTETGLMSNTNFYFIAQQLFLYYSSLQVQGAQLVVQAYNYKSNASVSKLDSPLKVSAEAIDYYNRYLIGGTRADGEKPILEQQRDLYRSENEVYYSSFQGMVGNQLPSDLCVGLLPDVAQQNAPLFYNLESNLLLYGMVSQNLKNWTSGYDVLNKNPGAQNWVLPPIKGWRYPTTDEWNSIIASAKTEHFNDIFKYLFDRGLVADGRKSSFTSLWTRDSKLQKKIWQTNTHQFYQPAIPQPTDSAYSTYIDWWRKDYGGGGLFGHGPWNYRFTGTYPLAFTSTCATEAFSSLILGGEDYPWLLVSGGVMVTDAASLQSPAKVNSNPVVFEYNQTQVVYCDAQNHISNIWNNNDQWTYQDLSTLCGYNGEATGNPSVVVSGEDLYILFNDTHGKLHCMQYDGTNWTVTDITTQSQQNAGSGLTVPDAQGSPSAILFSSLLNVFYRDANNELSCIYLNGSQWTYYSPYQDSQASKALYGDPDAYIYQGQLHVLYPADVYMQACDIYYINNQWHFQLLSKLTPALGSEQGQGTVRGCQFNNYGQEEAHNVYRNENNHVADFYYTGQWGYQVLNQLVPGVNVPDANGNPVPFSSAVNFLHVVYQDSNEQLSDLYWNGSQWNYQNLYELVNSSMGVTVPAPKGPVSLIAPFFLVFRDENDELSCILYNGQDWVYQNLSQMAVAKAP